MFAKDNAALCLPFQHEEVNKLSKRSSIPGNISMCVSVCVDVPVLWTDERLVSREGKHRVVFVS